MLLTADFALSAIAASKNSNCGCCCKAVTSTLRPGAQLELRGPTQCSRGRGRRKANGLHSVEEDDFIIGSTRGWDCELFAGQTTDQL
jgi:hypothetical protein